MRPHSRPQHRPQAGPPRGRGSRTSVGRDTGPPRAGDTGYAWEGARGTGPKRGMGAAHRIGARGAPENGPLRAPSPLHAWAAQLPRLRCRHIGGDAAPPCARRARRRPRVRAVPPPTPAPHRARLTFLFILYYYFDGSARSRSSCTALIPTYNLTARRGGPWVRCGAVRGPRGDTASAAPIPHTAQSSREPRNTLKKTYSYIQYL